MRLLPKSLRPTGNSIIHQKNPFDENMFYPYKISFYQSGTAALAASIIATIKCYPDIKNPEVIIPMYCCPDIISAIIYANAKPVTVDLEENLPWLCIQSTEEAITDNTVCVIAVNFLGIQERIQILKKICTNNSISLIGDNAQGFPLDEYENYWGSDYNIISFGRGKPVNLLSGGAVVTRRNDLFDNLPKANNPCEKKSDSFLYIIKTHIYNLVINPYVYGLITRAPGLNIGSTIYKKLDAISSMNTTAISLLPANIANFKKLHTKRSERCKFNYMTKDENIIDLPKITHCPDTYPLLRYPLLIKDNQVKNELLIQLKDYGISTMYSKTLYEIEGVAEDIGHNNRAYPNAVDFANRLITLPCYEDISEIDIEYINRVLNSYK